MSDGRWLSVVICTYQGERFLAAALDSVVEQGAEDVELVVVDDGSTDGTRAILDSYTDRLPLRILEQVHGGNWVASTNRGISEARGRYISLLHQDDLWLPGRLDTLRKLTHKFPDAGFFVHPSRFIDAEGAILGHLVPPFPRREGVLDRSFVLPRLMVQNLFSIPAPLFSRALAQEIGDMDETAWFLADWEYWGRLVGRTQTIYHPRPLCAFRLHPQSQTTTRTSNDQDLRRQYYRVIATIGAMLDGESSEVRRASRAAHFNVDVSLALAAWSHGDRSGMWKALKKGGRLSWPCWRRFLRDSRIVQRVMPRLRINLHRHAHTQGRNP